MLIPNLTVFRRPRGFTLVELLVVMLIIAVLAGLLLPVLGAARRNAREMKSMTQTRNLHAAMVQYANRNGGWYPGFNEDGNAVDHQYRLEDKTGTASAAPNGDATPTYIHWLILKEGLTTADEVVSVSETDAVSPYDVSDAQAFDNSEFSTFAGNSTPEHFSFATLDPNTSNASSTIRKRNWRDNQNSQVVIASDRDTNVNESVFESIHTLNAGKWRGAMAWGDNHATFEEDPVVSTRLTQDTPSNADHLFYGQYDKTAGLNQGQTDDTFMMWYFGSDPWSDLADQPYEGTGN